MDAAALTLRLQAEMRDWSDYMDWRDETTPADELTDSDLSIEDATNETGWDLPLEDKSRIYWFKQRCKRHLLFYLATGQSRKFQAKAFALQHRFAHLKAMIESMDSAWKEYIDSNADMADAAAHQFGTLIGTGLGYDELGKEWAGTDLVTINPGDND